MDYKIFAHHAHLFPEGTRNRAGLSALKELLDTCGIEGAVCFAPFRYQYNMFGLDSDPVDFIYNELKNEKNLYGFGTIDFDKDNLEYQVEKIAGLGLKGIKIHPAAQEINIMGERARRVYEVAQKEGLFLSFHTGLHWHRISDYNVLLFDELAWNYPEIRFSMEHIGGYSFFREALLVMNNNDDGDRVFGGWTSVNMNSNGLPDYWSLSDDELRTVIHQTGNTKSIFGLDFPYKREDYIKASIDRIINLDIPEEAKRGIFGENLKRVLNID